MAMEKITVETEVSESELAVVLGVTGRRIRQLAEDGTIARSGRGRYRLVECVQRYYSQINVPGLSDDSELDRRKRTAEVMLKEAKARVAKMEADELDGKMHRAEDIEAINEDFIYTMRGDLLALPGRVAVDAAAAQSPAEAAEIVRKEVYAIMRELANYHYDPEKYAERVRDRMNWDAKQDLPEEE